MIGVLGLAFKPETDDMRDAPSLESCRGWCRRCAVRAFDPAAMAHARALLRRPCSSARRPGCRDGADALVLLTEWNEFRALAPHG